MKDFENVTEVEKEYLEKMVSDMESRGHKLLYLCKFGSHLYGTDTPTSDSDFKGIFLPSKTNCLLGDMPKHFTSSTGDGESKNSEDDLDVQFWSLQYWLSLVGKGETNALDLLYSATHTDMVVYSDKNMCYVFDNHDQLFTTNDCNSYVGYAIGQAKSTVSRVLVWVS